MGGGHDGPLAGPFSPCCPSASGLQRVFVAEWPAMIRKLHDALGCNLADVAFPGRWAMRRCHPPNTKPPLHPVTSSRCLHYLGHRDEREAYRSKVESPKVSPGFSANTPIQCLGISNLKKSQRSYRFVDNAQLLCNRFCNLDERTPRPPAPEPTSECDEADDSSVGRPRRKATKKWRYACQHHVQLRVIWPRQAPR